MVLYIFWGQKETVARTMSGGDSFYLKVYNMPTFLALAVLTMNLGNLSKQKVCETLVTNMLKGNTCAPRTVGAQEISPKICISAFFNCLQRASTSSVFHTFYFSSGFNLFSHYVINFIISLLYAFYYIYLDIFS